MQTAVIAVADHASMESESIDLDAVDGSSRVQYVLADGEPVVMTPGRESGGIWANLALGKVAQQSSTRSAGGHASRAVDGNTSGVFSNSSVTHTTTDLQPWWEVDLGAVVDVDRVRLWNRTDCCADRLNDVYVLISSQPFGSISLQDALNRGDVNVQYVATVDTSEEFTMGAPGRYVRVHLGGDTGKILSLAEVEVFGQIELGDDAVEDVYIHTDHLGTPRLATNSDGAIAWAWDSDAFGSSPPNQDPDGDGVPTILNLRFPGQYGDSESGLYYNWNRYYDPKTGRYITSDPIGLDEGLNTYGYVGGNPLYWIDPTGLFRWPDDIYNDALNDAQSSGLPGPHNGPQDAYRHCLASCESTRENTAPVTQCLAWANEKRGDWTRGQEEGEREMDDHNNSVGVGLGGIANNFNDCRRLCRGAVSTGTTINNYTTGSTPPYSPGSAY